MKKTFTLLSLLCITFLVMAQVPHRMSYQSVIRDADNNLVTNNEIGMQISILQGSGDGTAIYVERHFPVTNDNGLVSVEIGGGTVISGSFDEIDWGADIYFLKTETDLQGGANYTITGVSQVLSVPYALHAKTSETVTGGTEETDPVFTSSAAYEIDDDDILNWDEAYSWGNHTLEDYLTGESDPDFMASPAADIETSDILKWDDAFSWGNHALEDYITDETDPLFSASPAADIEASDILNWDEAHSWGDHTGEGYLTGETDPKWTGTADTGSDIGRTGRVGIGIDVPEALMHVEGGDAVIHDLTVGRGSGGIESNTAFGREALSENTTGEINSAIGVGALSSNTEGEGNTACGYATLYYNTSGDYNTAIGLSVLVYNTEGSHNTAGGAGALFSNTTGDYNTAFGYGALEENRANSTNTAIGYHAMRYADNTLSGEDTYNTAVGYQALRGSITAHNNTGVANTAIGIQALLSNTSGIWNTATGAGALNANTEGSGNTATGLSTLAQNITGNGNTAIGYLSGFYHTNVEYGTFVGSGAYANSDDLSNVTGIGYQARPTSNNMVRIGNSGVTSIGGYTSWTNLSDERYKRNIDTDVAGLDFILKLRPVTYNLEMNALSKHLGEDKKMDEDGNVVTKTSESDLKAREAKAAIRQTGFVAQEVEAAAKAIGYDFSGVDAPQNEGSLYGLRYAEFVVPLVKAVQEQQDMIENQQEMIKILQEQIDALRSLIDQ